jgi:hypothetical protein
MRLSNTHTDIYKHLFSDHRRLATVPFGYGYTNGNPISNADLHTFSHAYSHRDAVSYSDTLTNFHANYDATGCCE